MVYASVPAYLDPPNWNQQHHHHHQQQQQQHHHQQQHHQQHQGHQAGGSGGGTSGGGDGGHHQLLSPMPPWPEGGSGIAAATVRPGSMADRARLAKVPQPEPALKCPRCDSTNTKFCYFNNYSLSQPRHFCKTCRRYWTRGGALRNVPVGGGCRRNKRSKSGSSKSSASNNQTGTSTAGGASAGVGAIASHISAPPQLPFMASLHPLSDYGATNIGLNYGGLQTIDQVDYHQLGSSSGSMGLEHWRLQQLQQFPFFAGLEQQTTATPALGLYQFDGESGVDGASFAGQAHGKATAAGLSTQLASVKMEESQQGLNLSRQYLGIPASDQFWNSGGTGGGGGASGAGGGNSTTGGGWTDLSGFNSSTTGNLL